MVDIDTFFAFVTNNTSHKFSLKSGSKNITHLVRSNYHAQLFGKTFDFTSMSDLDAAKVILVDILYNSIAERGLTERNPFYETWYLANGATRTGHHVRERTSANVLAYINEVVAKKPMALLWMALCMPKHIIVPMSWAGNKEIIELIAMFGSEVVGPEFGMNMPTMQRMFDNAAAAVQRYAGRIDNINMNLIEYDEGGRGDYERERYETLKAQYEEACNEVTYWAAKVYS